MALAVNSRVKKAVSEPLPEGVFYREGEDCKELSGFIKMTCKKYGIRSGHAAAVLPAGLCICRKITLPVMNRRQLKINLPYEFRDFVSRENGGYYYDYAVLGTDPEGEKMTLLAVAAPSSAVNGFVKIFKNAGIKLKAVIPPEAAYANLFPEKDGKNRCILDLGYLAARIYMYGAGGYESSHTVECDMSDGGLETYKRLAGEIDRALHFLRYTSPELEPECIYPVGGGAKNGELMDVLRETLSVEVGDCVRLFDKDVPGITDFESAACAIGAAKQWGRA